MARLSGLQKDVLALYRALLRTVRLKHNMSDVDKRGLHNVVKTQFRENAGSVLVNQYQSIEHLLRQGYKQKKYIEMPSFVRTTNVV